MATKKKTNLKASKKKAAPAARAAAKKGTAAKKSAAAAKKSVKKTAKKSVKKSVKKSTTAVRPVPKVEEREPQEIHETPAFLTDTSSPDVMAPSLSTPEYSMEPEKEKSSLTMWVIIVGVIALVVVIWIAMRSGDTRTPVEGQQDGAQIRSEDSVQQAPAQEEAAPAEEAVQQAPAQEEAAPAEENHAEEVAPVSRIYIVKESDTGLYGIARSQLGKGNRWEEIFNMNRDILPNPNSVKAGQRLKLPAK